MKVIHIESGLGNQMLSYCELIALKKINPNEKYYIENIIFDIEQAKKVVCQWNGYELERIFHIEEPNVKELFSDEQWENICKSINESRFWEKNWNWPYYFTKAFQEQGLTLNNVRGNFETQEANKNNRFYNELKQCELYKKFQKSYLFSNLRTLKMRLIPYTYSDADSLFYQGKEDCLMGQRLSFMYKNNQIERIEKEIRDVFQFPEFENKKNKELSEQLKNVNSVAIHARRGDLLNLSERYYTGGYFKRAVNYIKKNVENPSFIFFCDLGSTQWCRENVKIFGLDLEKDNVLFVDWNAGLESYRDMQLMSMCKHNIITISSFGWWGAFLNSNPNKITIAPENYMNTTHFL